MKRTEEEILKIIAEYKNGASEAELKKKYHFGSGSLYKWLKQRGIKTNRFDQKYIVYDDHAEIQIKTSQSDTGYVYALIDLDDIERCKAHGIWSITKAGYVICCATGIYLHRFILNCPEEMEVDHIFHNLLDYRKSKLRLATSSQQCYNQGIRTDNTSGHRGVYYDTSRGTWNVNINFGEHHFRHRFHNKQEAFSYADNVYDKYFGEYKYKTEEAS